MYEPMITSKKENSKTRVAIFGGSFDPPTIAHMQIACEIYNNFEHIDQVWIVPCGDGRCDIKLRTPANHRLNMLHLIKDDLIAHNVPIFIDETEINRGEYIPTYYLLKELEETHKDMEFVFCIGTDLLEGLKTWDECDKFAMSNRCKEVCKMKSENPKLTAKDISEITLISHPIVCDYLHKGTQFGWCYYNRNNKKRIQMLKDGSEIGVFDSAKEITKLKTRVEDTFAL